MGRGDAPRSGVPVGAAAPRDRALDGLRAIAATTVVCFHAWLYAPGGVRGSRPGLDDQILFEARVGLILFFVLSGFLLYRPWARAIAAGAPLPSVRRYARRRVARIVPAYLISIAGAAVLLYTAAGTPGVRLPPAEMLPLFALFAQTYVPETAMTLSPVTWTLCVEAAFYVALPAIGLLAVRAAARRPAAQPKILAALVAVAVVWNVLVHRQAWSIVAAKALPGFLAYFAAGMVVAAWVETRAARAPLRKRTTAAASGPARLAPLVTAALALAGLGLVVANGYWHSSTPEVDLGLAAAGDVLAATGFALIVVACVVGTGPAIAWLGHPGPAAVGRWSYGIYLWHVPLLLFGRWAGIVPPGFTGAALFMLTTATLAGAASWHLIERPALERVRGRTPRRVPRPVPAPA